MCRDVSLVRVAPLIERVGQVAELFESETDYRPFAALRAAEGSERPLGDADFMARDRADRGPPRAAAEVRPQTARGSSEADGFGTWGNGKASP